MFSFKLMIVLLSTCLVVHGHLPKYVRKCTADSGEVLCLSSRCDKAAERCSLKTGTKNAISFKLNSSKASTSLKMVRTVTDSTGKAVQLKVFELCGGSVKCPLDTSAPNTVKWVQEVPANYPKGKAEVQVEVKDGDVVVGCFAMALNIV